MLLAGVHHRGTCTDMRISLIFNIPAAVRDAKAEQWEESFADVKKFYQEHTRLPQPDASGDEKLLGMWADRQRSANRKNKLPHTYIRRLDQFPGWHW